MADLTLSGAEYQTGKLNAMKQFHVARRLAPVLGAMAGMVASDPVKAFAPFAEAIAGMSDEDADYVLFACLDVTRRKQTTGWAPIRSGAGLMFDDIDLPVMVQIAAAVLQENLGGFFGEALAASGAE